MARPVDNEDPRPLPGGGPLTAEETEDILAKTQRAAEAFVDAGSIPDATDAAVDDALHAQDIRAAIERKRRTLLAEKAKQQREIEEKIQAALEEGLSLETALADVPLDPHLDETVMSNSDGSPAGTPGRHKRWVRMTDSREQPNGKRAHDFARVGYQAIKDSVTGKPLTGQFGMAMECEPEAEARRVVYHQHRVVDKAAAEKDALLDGSRKGMRVYEPDPDEVQRRVPSKDRRR